MISENTNRLALLALAGLVTGCAQDISKGKAKADGSGSAEGKMLVGADSSQKNCCVGKNDCKGKGGCKTDAHACAGKNDCKGQGGCSMRDCK